MQRSRRGILIHDEGRAAGGFSIAYLGYFFFLFSCRKTSPFGGGIKKEWSLSELCLMSFLIFS